MARWMASRAVLPAGVCELEDPPRVAALVVPAGMDRQQATTERMDGTTARLRVKLPRCAAPVSGREWAAPATEAGGHRVALGFDWGVNTLLTGMTGRLTERGEARRVHTDGRPLIFDATTLETRGHRKGNARLSGQVRGTHCSGCGLPMDRDHAAGRRVVARGLLAQTHTVTERATGTRTIRTTVEGTVTQVRRPKKTTRRLRRQRHEEMAPPRPRGTRPRRAEKPGTHRHTQSSRDASV